MRLPVSPRLAGLAAVASVQLVLGGTAIGQTVRMFDEPPPLELLRSIMIPESQPGLSRRIVIGQPERPAPALSRISATEQASLEPAPVPRMPQQPSHAAEPAQPAALAYSPIPAPVERRPAAPAPAAPRRATAEAAPADSIGFRINFALNSDVMPQSAYPFVERIGELLREQPQLRLRVEGHTDALGSDEYNLDLSQRRAVAVASYLVQRQGIAPERLVVIGLGETAPLMENPFDGRNRRVQFTRVE